jgi:hypothetical protein
VIDIDSRLRIARAVMKTEGEGALAVMALLKQAHAEMPPAMASDAGGGYVEALLETWGRVPVYRGTGRPSRRKRPVKGWKFMRVKKIRSGSRLLKVRARVMYGDPEEVKQLMGGHTAYIERSQLTSRQMNRRLSRKTLAFSKQLRLLRAACALEDAVYNWVRPHASLRRATEAPGRKWERRTPAMVAGLADRPLRLDELLRLVPVSLLNSN